MSNNYPFRIMQNTPEAVVLENMAKTSLDIARFPYISSNIDYINITKGANHICTIVNSDASTFSFSWGQNGYTQISHSLRLLKTKAYEFIQSQGIALDVNTTMQPNSFIVMYNPFFKAWQATLGFEDSNQEEHFIDTTATNQLEMIETVRNTFNKSFNEVIHTIAPTGIDIWVSKADDTFDLDFRACL